VLGISSASLANQRVHVAVVFPNGVPSTSNSKIYINGILQTLTQLKGTPLSRTVTPGIFMSGWGFDSNYKFGGSLENMRIYNRELTATEVAALAGGTALGNLVGYWKLDDGSGTLAADSSGSGHNGTLFNGPRWVAGKSAGAVGFNGANQYIGASGLGVNSAAGGSNTWHSG